MGKDQDPGSGLDQTITPYGKLIINCTKKHDYSKFNFLFKIMLECRTNAVLLFKL